MKAHHIQTANDVARELKRMNAMLHSVQQALRLFLDAAEDDFTKTQDSQRGGSNREAV